MAGEHPRAVRVDAVVRLDVGDGLDLRVEQRAMQGERPVVDVETLAQRIEAQNSRNAYLQTQIAELDKQIDEIKKLKEQTQAMLDRKKVVEALQTNRTETVRLLDQLVRQLPDGLYLKAIKQTNEVVNMVGYASSNARVSTLMRNLDASPWLEDPKLVEIKAARVGNSNVNEFNLNIPRYVDTFEEAEAIDLKAVREERLKLKAELAVLEEKMAGYLKELGYE